MKVTRRVTKIAVFPLCLCAVLLLGACRTGAVYNVNLAPVPTGAAEKKPSLEHIQKAIIMAGSGLGWTMRAERLGLVDATLNLRGHQAEVSIPYTQDSFSIVYKNSVDLKYDGTKIHSQYNTWIHNLENAINRNLVGVAY